jgi:hypothetical protein
LTARIATSQDPTAREDRCQREKKAKGIEIHWATYAYAAMTLGILNDSAGIFVTIHFISDKEQRLATVKNT